MQLRDMLQHYSWVIRHRFRLILLGVTICTATTLAISFYLPPVYQASAWIKVNGTTTATTSDVFSDQALAVSYALLITTPDVLQATDQQLHGLSLKQLESAVSDSPIDNTQLIEVRAQANDPLSATTIANTVVNTFIQLQVTKEKSHLQTMVAQLSANLTTAKSDLNAAQNKLTLLQSTHTSEETIGYQKALVDTYQTNYDGLLTDYHQLQAQQLQASDILTIAQLAIPPDKPISPQITLNTIIAASMSLLVMVVLALLLDWADASIKTPHDAMQLAGIEPLGSIPLSKEAEPFPPSGLPLMHDTSVEDAFISIWTNFATLHQRQRSILVTGMQSKAGTSTVATNLAILLAQSGQRILLIDANLRRPSLHELFHTPNTRGLVNCPSDVQRLKDQPDALLPSWLSQWKTNIPNLWVLPTGPVQGHSTALLRLPEMYQLLQWLCPSPTHNQPRPGTVDMIIFDAPSIGERSETILLAPVTEATILVIEAGKTQKEELHTVRTMLQKLETPLLGVVINRQQAQYRSYFYTNQHYANRYEHAPIVNEPRIHPLEPSNPVHNQPLDSTTYPLPSENALTMTMPLAVIDTDEHEVPETPPFSLRPLSGLHLNLPSLRPDPSPRTSSLGYYSNGEEKEQ